MISHLENQMFLAIGLAVVVLAYHFYDRVLAGLGESMSSFDPARTIPYISAMLCSFYLLRVQGQRRKDYAEFLRESPGIPVDTTGVNYGPGHGH